MYFYDKLNENSFKSLSDEKIAKLIYNHIAKRGGATLENGFWTLCLEASIRLLNQNKSD